MTTYIFIASTIRDCRRLATDEFQRMEVDQHIRRESPRPIDGAIRDLRFLGHYPDNPDREIYMVTPNDHRSLRGAAIRGEVEVFMADLSCSREQASSLWDELCRCTRGQVDLSDVRDRLDDAVPPPMRARAGWTAPVEPMYDFATSARMSGDAMRAMTDALTRPSTGDRGDVFDGRRAREARERREAEQRELELAEQVEADLQEAMRRRAAYIDRRLRDMVAFLEAEQPPHSPQLLYALEVTGLQGVSPVCNGAWMQVEEPVIKDAIGTTWLVFRECRTPTHFRERDEFFVAMSQLVSP